MTDPAASVLAQFHAFGMPKPERLNPCGRIVRYGPRKRAWYVLRELALHSGEVVWVGAFGLWGRIDATKIEVDWHGISQVERERVQREYAAREARERAKRELRAQAAANRARAQYAAAHACVSTPYLLAKGVKAERPLRSDSAGELLVPCVRYGEGERGRLVGLQKIRADGTKRFNRGMAKQGAACRFGAQPKDGQIVFIAEGAATALSVREAIGRAHAVYVAFDCGNLAPVARVIRDQLPHSPIVFCADDDHTTEGNPGRASAEAAARAVGNARVVWPIFPPTREPHHTDFNDLHASRGLLAVSEQLAGALNTAFDAGPKKRKPKPVDADGIKGLLERYVLIYGTETVWDRAVNRIIRLSALRAAFGEARVKIWQTLPARKLVDERAVVFDPAAPLEPEGGVNMFRGWSLNPWPRRSDPAALIALLHHLVNDDLAVAEWVLRWIAYPLQHPGAKMRTAIVMWGTEGAGKNMFWGALRAIYGDYAIVITQTELESQFNSWASRRLLVIGNEVLSRQELRHHVGRLKAFVTDDELQINEKNLPLRAEQNHFNMVFLSNEKKPVLIGPDDRRYLVVKTPAKLNANVYSEVAAELAAGGAERFYRYLLEYDCGDFSPHTKPIETEAKRDLIERSQPSSELFLAEWQAGLLPMPFGPCLSEDLYRAYQIWCRRGGERNPAKINDFSQDAKLAGLRRQQKRVDVPGRTERQQRTVFLYGEPDLGEAERDWLKKKLDGFRGDLDAYARGEQA